MNRILPALALAAVLSACATPEDQAVRNDPNFQAGYSAGCSAAVDQGASYREGPKRDENLYENDVAYRRGWGSGYASCRRTMTPSGTEPSSNPVPSPSPGH